MAYAKFPTLNHRADVDYGASDELEFSIKSVNFGDGYEQLSPAGINSIRSTFNITFSNLTIDDAQLVEAFIRSKKGVEPFLFDFNREESRAVTCSQLSRTVDNFERITISAQFRESHQ
ncbi:phage tail protein [Salinicola sp. V024]|uniref:phage tail protein n=1 Tax=Salinicola sp. V024 TaxID=3459609 RepID=UPI004044291F